MGLWKHGVEQILAVAGMQTQEEERKKFARQISTKVRRGAMCSPGRKPEKEAYFQPVYSQSKRKGNRKKRQFQWALPGAT